MLISLYAPLMCAATGLQVYIYVWQQIIYLYTYSISYGIICLDHMCVVSVVLVDVGRSRRRSDDESRSRSRERRQKKANKTDREQSGDIHV